MPFCAYLDASGDETLPALSVGGFIASPDKWLDFNAAWLRVLDEFGVPDLHMREFTAFRGPFESWKSDEDKRRRFLQALTDVMHHHTNKSVTATMFMRDYQQVNRVFKVRERLGTPYSFTMLSALILAREWQQEHHPTEHIETFIEHGDSDQHELLGILKRIAFDHPVTPRRKKATRPDGVVEHVLPFQACDFLAYESAKAAKTAEERNTEQFIPRKSMALVAPDLDPLQWTQVKVLMQRTLAVQSERAIDSPTVNASVPDCRTARCRRRSSGLPPIGSATVIPLPIPL